MPSWNIHIAHAERLLAHDGLAARLICDRNAFLLGNVVPDIFVGYMVPGVEEPIPYRVTHFAKPEPIPKPREDEFWGTYVAPLVAELGVRGDACRVREVADLSSEIVPASSIADEREAMNRIHYPARYEGVPEVPRPTGPGDADPSPEQVRRSVFDLCLGVWAHLLADKLWNTRVNEYLEAQGGTLCEEFRIKKQGDFDWFGKTLGIVSVPRATERLFAAAEAFPQYRIDRMYVLKTIGVMHEIVRGNPGDPDHPPYRLLTDEFFSRTSREVRVAAERLLSERL